MVAIIQITAITVSVILSLEETIISEDKSVGIYNGTISQERLKTAETRHTDIIIYTKETMMETKNCEWSV